MQLKEISIISDVDPIGTSSKDLHHLEHPVDLQAERGNRRRYGGNSKKQQIRVKWVRLGGRDGRDWMSPQPKRDFPGFRFRTEGGEEVFPWVSIIREACTNSRCPRPAIAIPLMGMGMCKEKISSYVSHTGCVKHVQELTKSLCRIHATSSDNVLRESRLVHLLH